MVFQSLNISLLTLQLTTLKNSLNGKPESFGIRIGVREQDALDMNISSNTPMKNKGDILFDESSFKIYVDNSFEFLKVRLILHQLTKSCIIFNNHAKVTCGCGESSVFDKVKFYRI